MKKTFSIILMILFIFSIFTTVSFTYAGDNLGISWASGSNDAGNFTVGTYAIDFDDIDQAGFVFNDDEPMIFSVYIISVGYIIADTLIPPTEVLIDYDNTGGETFTITVYLGDVAPEKLILDYDGVWGGDGDSIEFGFKYYTSGIAYDMFEFGYDFGNAYDVDSWTLGFNAGQVAGFMAGEIEGYNNGREIGLIEGYADGYSDGKADYGYYNGSEWLDYDDGILNGYGDGYADGLAESVNESIIAFNNGFDQWIVPVVILIIFGGGFFSILALKRKNRGD